MKLPDTPLAKKLQNLITRWTKTAKADGKGYFYRYYSRCTAPSCEREISLQKFQSRQVGNLQCRACSKIRGYVHGVPIRSARIWALRKLILEFRTVDDRLQPFIACARRGCKEPVLLRHDKYHAKASKVAGFCRNHRVNGRTLAPYASQYNLLKSSATRRSIPCRLSHKSFLDLYLATSCHYCLCEMSKHPYGLKSTQGLGIDRKDSSKGYTKENCVACCPACNFAKNSFISYAEMRLVGAVRAQDATIIKNRLNDIDLRKNAGLIKSRLKSPPET